MQLSNEHSFIFLELEKLMEEEYPDIDRINLLLDILKVKINLFRTESEPTVERGRPTWTTPSNRWSTQFYQECIDMSWIVLYLKMISLTKVSLLKNWEIFQRTSGMPNFIVALNLARSNLKRWGLMDQSWLWRGDRQFNSSKGSGMSRRRSRSRRKFLKTKYSNFVRKWTQFSRAGWWFSVRRTS